MGAGRSQLAWRRRQASRSEEHTSELQSHSYLVCRLLLEKKKSNGGLPSVGQCQPHWCGTARSGRAASESHPAMAGPTNVARHFVVSSEFDFFFLNKRGPPNSSPFPLPAPFQF